MIPPPVRREPYRVAIAGLGRAAQDIHLPAYRKVGRIRVVGGTDPAPAREDFGFPLFPDLETMLRKTKPDIVAVVTPPSTHFELTRAALQVGAHVLCEKPFMSTMTDADSIVALARECSRHVVVNHQYRYMNIHRRARELIDTPEFGPLQFASLGQTFFVSPETETGWRGAETRRTGQEFGIHVLDLCRYFFGEDPIALRCRMPRGKDRSGPDYLNLIELEFSGDRMASIVLDRLCRGRHRYLDIRLDGANGCIETHIGGKIELAVGVRGGTRRPFITCHAAFGGRADLWHGERCRRIASDPLDLMANATSKLVDEFLDALEKGETPPCDANDNRRSLALMLAAYESNESGCRVTLRYD